MCVDEGIMTVLISISSSCQPVCSWTVALRSQVCWFLKATFTKRSVPVCDWKPLSVLCQIQFYLWSTLTLNCIISKEIALQPLNQALNQSTEHIQASIHQTTQQRNIININKIDKKEEQLDQIKNRSTCRHLTSGQQVFTYFKNYWNTN